MEFEIGRVYKIQKAEFARYCHISNDSILNHPDNLGEISFVDETSIIITVVGFGTHRTNEKSILYLYNSQIYWSGLSYIDGEISIDKISVELIC